MKLFDKTVVAIVQTIAKGNVVNEPIFVLKQCASMPDHLRFVIRGLTVIFTFYILLARWNFFHRLLLDDRIRVLNSCRDSRFNVLRNFVRFYDTLTVFVISSSKEWAK